MAEALGIISGCITIWQLAYKVKDHLGRMKVAPDLWNTYRDKLRKLENVRLVLVDMLSVYDDAADVARTKMMANLVAWELQTIEDQVKPILEAYKVVFAKRKRLLYWVRAQLGTLKFVIADEHLKELIRSAEEATASLRSAICLHKLEILSSGQTQVQDALKIISDSMKKHEEALTRIHLEKGLDKVHIQVVDGRGQAVDYRTTSPPSRLRDGRNGRHQKSERHHKARRKHHPKNRKRDLQSRNKRRHKHSKDVSETRSGVRTEESNHTAAEGDVPVIVATDTSEYKSTAGQNYSEAQSHKSVRGEENLQSTSDDTWEQDKASSLCELQSSRSSTPSSNSAPTFDSTNNLNAYPDNDLTPIRIHTERGNRSSVEKAIVWRECMDDKTNSMLFCVSSIFITNKRQTFTIEGRCQHDCEHVGLLTVNSWPSKKKLPHTRTIKFARCGQPDEIIPGLYIPLQPSPKCQNEGSCSHTRVKGDEFEYNGRIPKTGVCVRFKILAARFGDCGQEDADTPNLFPQDDDEHALVLFEAIELGCHTACSHVPAQVPFGVLVEFLKLIERRRMEEEEFLESCYIWTKAILSEVPTSLDENTIAWAWVFWKLKMGPEFKALSGMIQQQANHCVAQQSNQYGVHLPQHIACAIDAKRISTLSQIRRNVKMYIKIFRTIYLSAIAQQTQNQTTLLKIIQSSLMMGYLTLEYERCLLNGQQGQNANFDGVSFADASGWIKSMMNFGDCMVRTVPPARRMPFMVSSLAALIPVVGVAIHETGISTCLSSSVYEDLNGLVKRLEEEDWGVDLHQDES